MGGTILCQRLKNNESRKLAIGGSLILNQTGWKVNKGFSKTRIRENKWRKYCNTTVESRLSFRRTWLCEFHGWDEQPFLLSSHMHNAKTEVSLRRMYDTTNKIPQSFRVRQNRSSLYAQIETNFMPDCRVFKAVHLVQSEVANQGVSTSTGAPAGKSQ